MSAMEITDGTIPNQTSNELVSFIYGTDDDKVQVQVRKWVLCLFSVFRNINEDLPSEDNSFYANIPIINDGKLVPIHFSEAELILFFELAAIEPLTIQHLEDSEITQELLNRFLILVNFLDYEPYLQTLCEYAGKLLFEGNYKLD
jgi:hypothetical protein